MLNGLDISENQGEQPDNAFGDWVDFVWIRSCYGDDHIDVFAERYADIARAQGKLVGHYCYALPDRSSGPTQARFFLDAIPNLRPGEPLALDLEEDMAGLDWWADQFARVVKDVTNKPPLLYTNHDFLSRHGFGVLTALDCGLWIAEPDNQPGQVNGAITPWGFAAFKQFTFGGGDLNGVAVDQDSFYGDADQFRAYGMDPPANA